ncbi:MAG: transcription antitermination factor NusB [Vicinamibacterales bacterium]
MSAESVRGARDRDSSDSRHRAREAAVQMLYQWEVGRVPMTEVRVAFWQGPAATTSLSDVHRAFAGELADGVVASVDTIDPLIREAAEHWRVERMNVLDRLIMRLAVYEFLHEPDTPAKVIINEALDLARTFSGDESVRFINGVLDAIRREQQRA